MHAGYPVTLQPAPTKGMIPHYIHLWLCITHSLSDAMWAQYSSGAIRQSASAVSAYR